MARRNRSTIDRTQLVSTANRMLAHLAESGTKSDADKREAIVAVVDQILLDGDAYQGFRFMDPKTNDRTRIQYYG